ncbi:calcium-binding protein [Nocardioides iriomotensis]|uniref:Calcium-binding protein n=1 Tax=Nocardioides iriomotensis TaxID=715784 RepID=A0A4Q5JCR2_9ACTN|nr:calcium-binding protein [Nocardioides iriomotensis]RYU15715.1 calcium-binding protein [Nocardioides iriomotensis]
MHRSRALVAAVVTVLLAPVPAVWADDFEGTAGADEIVGTARGDTVLARAGDDVVRTRAGKDFVSGGGGNDRVVAGAGKDMAYGGAGDDVLRGGRDADALTDWVPTSFDSTGPADDDLLVGGAGADLVGITRGVDTVRAGAGNDLVKLAADGVADSVLCGPGRDRVLYYGLAVDPLDVLVGCERVRSVTPGVPTAQRARWTRPSSHTGPSDS